MRRRSLLAAVPALAMPSIARASEEEVRIGNIMPYSGPASALSEVGKTQAAYIKMLNDNGGISGRRLSFITLDDGYSPPKAVEHARRLVEQDRVALMFSPLGTPGISATIKYFNDRKVPHLFAVSGVSRFSDAKAFPYTVMSLLNYQTEARIYAKLIEKERPGARIAVLYQNDDLGKDYLVGLRGFFKERYDQRVVTASYELTDPTVESQVINLKATGAEVLLVAGTPKFASQAIRKAHDLDWKAMIVLKSSVELAGVDDPAGRRRAIDRGHHRRGRQGSRRSPAGERCRRLDLSRFPRQAPARRQSFGCQRRVRLQSCDGAGGCPHAMRQRSQPREHHAPGTQHQEACAPDAADRRRLRYQPRQPLDADADGAAAMERQDLRAAGPGDQRRGVDTQSLPPQAKLGEVSASYADLPSPKRSRFGFAQAGGGVMSIIIVAHDPSVASRHLPARSAGRKSI